MGFWPDKREIALYWLLRKRFGDEPFNVGEALEVTKPYYPKRVALNVMERLSKLGLLEKTGKQSYRATRLDEWLDARVSEYLEGRRRRYSSSSS